MDGTSITNSEVSLTSYSMRRLCQMIVKSLQHMHANTMAKDSQAPMEQRCGSQGSQREASGVWIKGFICRSCGSSLGRWSTNNIRGGADKMCFCCGAGEFELSDMELAGLDFEQGSKLSGREWGDAMSIYVRVNNPVQRWSSNTTSRKARDNLAKRYDRVIDTFSNPKTKSVKVLAKRVKTILEEE